MIGMARSKLYPPFMNKTFGKYYTPAGAVVAGSVLGYCLVIAVYLYPAINSHIYNICIQSAFTAYITQLIGYILFNNSFPNQERSFKSPFGKAGAIFAILVFILSFLGVIAFQDDNCTSFISFLCLVCIYTIYYHFYARKRQDFSSDEKFIYLVNIVKCK